MRIEWGKAKEGETPLTPASEGAASAPAPTTASGVRRAAAGPITEAPKSLAHVLMQEGSITPGQMKEALNKQKSEGGFLGQILIDMGCFDENSLTSFLAKQCKIPHLSLLDYLFDSGMFEYIPRDVCIELRVLPIDKLGRNLTVGMVNPLDVKAREKIRELCPDLRIKPILCAFSHFKKVMEKNLGDEKGGATREMSLADYGFASSEPSDPDPNEEETKKEEAKKEEAKKEEPPAAVEEPGAVEPVVEEPAPVEPVAEEIPAVVPEPDLAEPALNGDTLLGAIMSDDGAGDATDAEEPNLSEADPSKPADVMEEMLGVMRDSMRDTYAVLARRMALFRGLNSEEVAKIFATGMTAEHDAGDTIFEKGDKSDELHVVLSGKVDVVDEGRTVATIEAGGLLGEMAWISDEPRSASAVATEATSLITLNDDVFENLVSKEASIQLLMNIILTLTERLRAANDSK